jgi:hypothetical protein
VYRRAVGFDSSSLRKRDRHLELNDSSEEIRKALFVMKMWTATGNKNAKSAWNRPVVVFILLDLVVKSMIRRVFKPIRISLK